jgi:thioredoxin-dependent peroxiredoxin
VSRPWLAAALGVLLSAAAAHAAELAPGAKAPNFALAGSEERVHRLADFVGQRGVVLAWFPKAFTSGCTQELASLRDSVGALAAFDVAVFLVSLDSAEKNAEFAESLGAKHVLLSDPLGEAAKAYGVVGNGAGFAKRWTFYIDRDGVIREIDRNVSTSSAGQDIARKLGALGFPKR